MIDQQARSCWTSTNARDVLVTEALAGDDALFLATHTPVRGFEVRGPARDVGEASEEGLLRALADPARRHAFCVVQGEPGSGKSHLIRWLSVNWPSGPDLPLLIQRANGSLEGALRQLQSKLPSEFQHLFHNLGRRQAAALSGRASQFLLTLGAALAPDFFEKSPEDAGWCRDNDPSSLVLSTQVRQAWSGPMRILKLMDGKDGNRNSAPASFGLEDVLDLARHCAAFSDSGPAERLARRLVNEATFVREALAGGKTIEDVKVTSASEVRSSLTLVDALNARRNFAVQQVIGVSADGLKKLFEELRSELAKRGWRIVLLLEDITSWEGLDDSLVDALVTDAQTRPEADLCPLISVVGVTPEYYVKLPGNYRQRITHDIRLGQQQGQLQDVAALREPGDRASFVARYLNAARTGPELLREWRKRFRAERTLAPPNACEGCGRIESCHAVFGEIDGIGLFPFTREAVDNLFFSLKEDDSGQTHRTPRGLVQAVLSPTLLQPKVMDDGEYPGPQLENAALERRLLPGVLQGRLASHVSDPKTSERLRRLLAYWGDRRPELRSTAADGQIYAGVKRSLIAAFGLPWIADDVAEEPAYPPATQRSPDPTPTPVTTVPPVAEDLRDATNIPGINRPRLTLPPRTGTQTGTTGSRPSSASRQDLEQVRGDVAALREDRPPQNSTSLNRALFDVLQQIDYRKLGVDRWTWGKLFTPETVKIAGTGAVRAQHLVVERSGWLADGLEAYATLRIGSTPEEENEFSRRRLAFMTRRLEALAAAHLERRVPRLATGGAWNPVATVAQILLARAWLRGTTAADRPTHEQWVVILGEEVPRPESDPVSRTQAWQDALNGTAGRHELLRKALQEMTRLPQGASMGYGIADASSVATAIAALVRECKLLPVPDELGEAPQSDLAAVREVAGRLDALPTIPAQERKLLTSRGEQLLERLRNQGVSEHLLRVDKIISDTAAQLPSAVPHLVREWKAALAKGRRIFDDPARVSRMQSAIFDLVDDVGCIPTGASFLLGWLAAAPAGDLKATLDLANAGESLIGELLPHARDLAADGDHAIDLARIHEHGTVLRAAAVTARVSLHQAEAAQ